MSGTEDFETKIEHELRDALKREAAPEGFAERVLARVRQDEAQKASTWSGLLGLVRQPAFRFAALAAVFVAMIGGVAEYRRYEQEQQAGRESKRQLMQALRVTGAKLQYAHQKVEGIGAQQFGTDSDRAERLQ